jgi:hypothetical protein
MTAKKKTVPPYKEIGRRFILSSGSTVELMHDCASIEIEYEGGDGTCGMQSLFLYKEDAKDFVKLLSEVL